MTAITLAKKTIIAECTSPPDILNMTQPYMVPETKKQKLERHYAVAKQNASKKE